jgi:hypothetical protein
VCTIGIAEVVKSCCAEACEQLVVQLRPCADVEPQHDNTHHLQCTKAAGFQALTRCLLLLLLLLLLCIPV